MKFSLARSCMLLFLALAFISSAAIYSLSRTIPAPAVALNQQAFLPVRISPLTRLAAHLHDTASRIALHPQTIQALKSGQEAARKAQLDNIRLLFPEADIQWAPPAGNMNGVTFTPPYSVVYSLSTMTAKKNTAPTLFITEPVTDPATHAILGFVSIGTKGNELLSIFNSIQPDNAYAELQQSNNGNPFNVLLRSGNARFKSNGLQTLTDIPGTAWRVVVWRTSPPPASTGEWLAHAYLITWMVIFTCLIFALAAFYFTVRKVLKNDMEMLLTFFSDIRHSRLRKKYSVQLKELEPNFKLMFQLGKLMLKKHQQVAENASVDHLSQVNNRRSLEAKLKELFKTVPDGWTHSLLIIDIDNFKHVNDTFGHDAGDALIVQIGKLLKEHLRSSDFIARLGGDEFCVIFPNTPLKRGVELANRLRESLPAEIELTSGIVHQLMWSGGLSEFKKEDENENLILSRADTALLESKRTGRNQTRHTA